MSDELATRNRLWLAEAQPEFLDKLSVPIWWPREPEGRPIARRCLWPVFCATATLIRRARPASA